jgi:hypothetical protein
LPRLIQTTIASEISDKAISTVFVRKSKAFGLYHRRYPGLRGLVDLPISPRQPSSECFPYIDGDWLGDFLFQGDLGEANARLLSRLLNREEIVIEHSPPTLTSLAAFLKNASGVAIGAFIGISAGIGSPMLMFITVPFGMLIVGTASGIGNALEQGLRDKLLEILRLDVKLTADTKAAPVLRKAKRPRLKISTNL